MTRQPKSVKVNVAAAFRNVLEPLVREAYPRLHPNVVLAPLERAFDDPLPWQTWFLDAYIRSATLMRGSVPARFLGEPLTAIASGADDPRYPRMLKAYWPFVFAALLVDNGFVIRIEVGARNAIGAVDILAHRDGIVPPSYWPTNLITLPSGLLVPGFVFECKSVSSLNALFGAIDDGADQVTAFGGGAIAIDVSGILAKQLEGSRATLGFARFHQEVGRLHAALAQEVSHWCNVVKRPRLRAVAAVLLHGWLHGRQRRTAGRGRFRTCVEYRRIHLSLNVSRDGSHPGDEIVAQFGKTMMACLRIVDGSVSLVPADAEAARVSDSGSHTCGLLRVGEEIVVYDTEEPPASTDVEAYKDWQDVLSHSQSDQQ